MADEWYRQLWSWGYQCAGYIALYDRHFLFDYSLENVDLDEEGFDTRLHRWFLTHAYPRPNLVIYLDAPAEVLYARKGEKNLKELETRRQSFLQLIRTNSNCDVIDATQPLSKVYDEVAARIFQFCKLKTRKPFSESEAVSESPAPVQPDPDPIVGVDAIRVIRNRLEHFIEKAEGSLGEVQWIRLRPKSPRSSITM